MALEATLRLRPKFHRFDLSLYLLESWLYNLYRQLIDQVEFEHYRSNMYNNSLGLTDIIRHLSVCVAVCYINLRSLPGD